jgi:hypothetical protein
VEPTNNLSNVQYILHSIFKYALAGYIAHMTVSAFDRKDSK